MSKRSGTKRREYYFYMRLGLLGDAKCTVDVPLWEEYWPNDSPPTGEKTIEKTRLSEASLRLLAQRQGWVLESIQSAVGKTIGEFCIESLIGFGAEKLVFRSRTPAGDYYALKLPWHPRSRCIEAAEMAQRVQQLEHEVWILQSLPLDAFPKFKTLIFSDSIIPSSTPSGKTPYLVEELIQGRPIEQALLFGDASGSDEYRIGIAQRFFQMLIRTGLHLAREGFLYTDYGMSNFIVSGEEIRIVDVGSVSFKVGGKVKRPRITLNSLPIPLFQRCIGNPNDFSMNETEVLMTIGRIVCAILCKQNLSPGEDVDSQYESTHTIPILRFAKRLECGEFACFEDVWAAKK